MTRALIVLANDTFRAKAVNWINNAPLNTRVEFIEPKRTLPQNKRMWAMLADISRQCLHINKKYTQDQWKVLFLHAIGRKTDFIPCLEGNEFVPYRQSSSDLSVLEMTDLIECMYEFGSRPENNVQWTEPVKGDMRDEICD